LRFSVLRAADVTAVDTSNTLQLYNTLGEHDGVKKRIKKMKLMSLWSEAPDHEQAHIIHPLGASAKSCAQPRSGVAKYCGSTTCSPHP
jgi:hypothetical protein